MTAAAFDEVSAHLPYGAHSARDARRMVTTALEGWGRVDLDEVATLLVSELLANVVLHAGTGADLYIRRVGDGVRIEVRDRSPHLPERKHYSASATTGRGMLLVEALSSAWGAERTATGKAVWFELDGLGTGAAPAVLMDDWAALGDEPLGERPPPPVAGAQPAAPHDGPGRAPAPGGSSPRSQWASPPRGRPRSQRRRAAPAARAGG